MTISESAAGGMLLGSAFVAQSLFGVPFHDLGIGTVCVALGVFGRGAYDLQRAIKSQSSGVPWVNQLTRVLGWVGSGLLGSPMGAIFVLVAEKQIAVHLGEPGADPGGMTLILLVGFGFLGADLLGPLWNRAVSILNQRLGLHITDSEGK